MRLLVITQKVDQNDSNSGFFHVWLEKLAAQVDHLYIICLEKGEYSLPKNVTVLSLGKEEKKSKLTYVCRLYYYIFKFRKEYQGVFVHMNPEYVILGGLFWRLWHKKILLWYTHKAVNLKLWLAEKLANKIFTVNKESFRLLSSKICIVGHGIEVDVFAISRAKLFDNTLKLLSVSRITPSKDLVTAMKAVHALRNMMSVPFRLTIVGAPITDQDKKYLEGLKEIDASCVDKPSAVVFAGAIPHTQLPLIYSTHHIFIHTGQTGGLDKTALEALAGGCIIVSSSEAVRPLVAAGFAYGFPAGDYQELAKTIEKIWKDGILEQVPNQRAIAYVREHHNLENVITKIIAYFSV